jgi:hypothetical protein
MHTNGQTTRWQEGQTALTSIPFFQLPLYVNIIIIGEEQIITRC